MINLSKQNECIVFEFTDNQHYLQDGKIEVPVNSLTVIADTSDMITIRKAASNDILLSANYDDFGMSKADLIEWFKVNAFANGGGSSITEIYVGTSADTVDPQTGEVHKEEGKKEWLCIVYKSEQGIYSLTKVNLNEFIIEGEFASGITSIEDGTVVGVVDPRQDKVVLTYNSGGTSATTGIVLSVNESGFTVNHIQDAIDAKVNNVKDIYVAKEGEYDKASQKITFKSEYDDNLFEIQLSGDTALSSGSTNFIQNSAITKVIEDNEKVISEALNDLETRKAEKLSAVTDGDVVEGTSAYTLSYKNESGDTLFSIDVPKSKAKPISGVNGVDVVSGETLDIISGVVDNESDIVVTKWNDDGTSATTDDVLSVSEDGFKVEHIQDAINAKHANTIKLNGYSVSADTEDLFSIASGDTVTQAFKKIEDKLYKDEDTKIIFDEGADETIILKAGTY